MREQYVRIKLDIILKVEQEETTPIMGPAFYGLSVAVSEHVASHGVNVTEIVKAKRDVLRIENAGGVTWPSNRR
jgi:hypothetical protein